MERTRRSKVIISLVTTGVLCLFVAFTSIPASDSVTGSLLTSQSGAVKSRSVKPQQESARRNRSRLKADERAYWNAVSAFNKLRKAGVEGLEQVLNINDKAVWQKYLDSTYVQELLKTLHGSATTDDPFEQLKNEPEQIRTLIEGYRLTERCPKRGVMDNKLTDDQITLCERLVEATKLLKDKAAQ